MEPSLSDDAVHELSARLEPTDAALARAYPGDPRTRQPVHTVYVPARRFSARTTSEHGQAALRALRAHAPDPPALAEAVGMPAQAAADVYPRVVEKLRREPVEDLRIDFEDGYGTPPDAEEDRDALAAAESLADAVAEGGASPFAGVRIKPFEAEPRQRAIRTLDLFLTALLDRAGGTLPGGFVVTFPKATDPAQVALLVEVLERLEAALGLAERTLRFELQIETTQAVVDRHGRVAIPLLLDAAQGRCGGLHFGTYDYTAACGLAAAQQHLAHPACDFARHVLQVAAAGRGVRLSDGSTNVLPVGDAEAVRRAWRVHYDLTRRSLEHGFYQGWDLHPAQLPTRFAAVFAFFRSGLAADGSRLRAYVRRQAGGVLDEPATAAALAAALLRALDCGATDETEVRGVAGLDVAALRGLARRGPPVPPG